MKRVYIIVGADRGDGFYRLSTAGVESYSTRAAALENLRRFLFKTGQVVLDVPVLDEPTSLGTPEQRAAWEEKKGDLKK